MGHLNRSWLNCVMGDERSFAHLQIGIPEPISAHLHRGTRGSSFAHFRQEANAVVLPYCVSGHADRRYLKTDHRLFLPIQGAAEAGTLLSSSERLSAREPRA